MNDRGEIINISITPGNKDDRAVVENLARNLEGWLFGDRGYVGKSIADKLRVQGLELITRIKKNMKAKLYSKAQKSFLVHPPKVWILVFEMPCYNFILCVLLLSSWYLCQFIVIFYGRMRKMSAKRSKCCVLSMRPLLPLCSI